MYILLLIKYLEKIGICMFLLVTQDTVVMLFLSVYFCSTKFTWKREDIRGDLVVIPQAQISIKVRVNPLISMLQEYDFLKCPAFHHGV